MDDKQLKRFKLLAIDFPGHGKSKWSDNKEKDYSLTGFRDLVFDLIKQLEITEFIFAGHSLGGHVAIECLPFVDNCKGIMIWGTPPVSLPLDTSQLFMPNPDMGLLFKQDLSEAELAKYGNIILNEEDKDFLIEIIKQADPQFRSFLAQSLASGKLSDEVNILKSSGVPVAILYGVEDPLTNKDYLDKLNFPNIWKNKILLFENSGHSIQLDNPEKFNKTLSEFAEYTL
jgi:pimeloyl-ACP methyl ester carboxylesterase